MVNTTASKVFGEGNCAGNCLFISDHSVTKGSKACTSAPACNKAWANVSTGELIIEKKFRKNEFDDVINHPEYGPYIDDLLERCMVKKFNQDELDIDTESYEEMRSIADAMIDIDPED